MILSAWPPLRCSMIMKITCFTVVLWLTGPVPRSSQKLTQKVKLCSHVIPKRSLQWSKVFIYASGSWGAPKWNYLTSLKSVGYQAPKLPAIHDKKLHDKTLAVDFNVSSSNISNNAKFVIQEVAWKRKRESESLRIQTWVIERTDMVSGAKKMLNEKNLKQVCESAFMAQVKIQHTQGWY